MKVTLKSSHLCLDAALVNQLLEGNPYVFLSYKEAEKQLLLSPVTNSWFPKMHDTHQQFLKTKNKEGDSATALHAIILDHDLDDSDRELEFTVNHKSRFLKIDLK